MAKKGIKGVEKATKAGAEIGSTGLRQSGGFIQEDFLPKLRGRRGQQTFREMANNDAVVGAILFAIEMLIRQVEWHAEPVDDSDEAMAEAEFLESCMHDMSTSWENLLAEILSFLVFGWSWHEIVYKQRVGPTEKDGKRRSKFTDGRIGWRKMPIRGQETLLRWQLDDNGGLEAMEQQDLFAQRASQTIIPIEKSLLFRTTTHKGNPEGKSILRKSWRSWWFKKRIEELEGIGAERDLAGIPVAFVPARLFSADASPEEVRHYNNIRDMLRKVKNDENSGIIMPSEFDKDGNALFKFELLSTGGRRQFQTDPIIMRYSKQIAMTVMADFLLLGHDKVGSFALSDSKTALFSVAIGTFLDEIASVFNRHAVPRLWIMNALNHDLMPTLKHGDIEKIDMDKLGTFISNLAGAGFDLFDQNTDQWIREVAGMPERLENDEGFEPTREQSESPDLDNESEM